MKRIIALLLCITMFFTGCAQAQPQVGISDESPEMIYFPEAIFPFEAIVPTEIIAPPETIAQEETEPQFQSLDDMLLLSYIEGLVYKETVASLGSAEYLVEDVRALYISKEYLEEVAFNSQSNIYFGYTLAELNELFQGTKYVFTLDGNGGTTVQELQEIEDTSTETIIKNVAIGTGVILVCVTVSFVSAGAVPAVSVIFAASAKTAAAFSVSSAAFGGISAGIVRGIKTEDFEEALEAASLAGSEGFKWGAITGAVLGGVKGAFSLKAATKGGLTMNEAARIQMDSEWPVDLISQLHSMDEYQVYKEAGLKVVMVNGKTALVPNIDLDYVSQLPDGTEVTNLIRMKKRYAAIEPATGKAYQLHHIGQKADGTLAVLTESQHQGNAAILNIAGKDSEIDRAAFDKIRKEFWKYLGEEVFDKGGI